MALSAQEKEKLNNFYQGKELYHPATAPEQEVSTFKPKPILGEPKGYDEGGSVTGDDFTVDGGASETAKDNGNPLTLATDGDQGAVATLVNKMGPPQIPPQLPPAAPPIPSTMPATPSQCDWSVEDLVCSQRVSQQANKLTGDNRRLRFRFFHKV